MRKNPQWAEGPARFGFATALTCQVDAFGDDSYELCILPHWDPSAALIERFNALTPALLRHAEVAGRLRENGWLVIDHADAGRSHAAA